jgi:amino acid adenylation domain-containing protein
MKYQFATKFQEQFWILNRIAKNNPAYNIPVVFQLNTKPDVNRLENVVNLLIGKYDVLLSEYSLQTDRVMMHFADHSTFKFNLSVERISSKQKNVQLPSEIVEEVHEPFDLSKAPLFRVKLFEYTNTYYLSFVFHHIIIDLRSKEIFFKELEGLYNEDLSENDFLSAAPAKQYGTYALEHIEWIKEAEAKKMMQLWKDELPPINHLLNLPLSKARPKSIHFEGKRNFFTLDKDIGEAINRYSSSHSINNFTFCLSAYFILLNKLSQQDKIVIGVPLSNRRDENNKDVVGCFVNILPIQIRFENNTEIKDIIKQVRNQLLFAHRKQEIPFLSIIEQEKENRNLAYNPYFQTGFTFEPLTELNLNGIDAKAVPIEKEGTQLDLFITLWENQEGFNGYIEYSTRLFSDGMAKRIEQSYKNVIKEILNNRKYVSEVRVLPNKDKSELQLWNNTNVNINTNTCLHKRFEEQAKTTPDEIAIRFKEKSLSYSQLNKHANRLSNFLIERGVQVEDIVAIAMDRSLELIVSILAIHKAGAAYLPIDASYPEERIEAIFEDGQPKLILTTSENATKLSQQNKVILIDNILAEPLSENDENPNVEIGSENLAYLLFTSGSTGRPKGVMIEHHSVINKLIWMQQQHPIGKNESLLLKTPITFDVSVWELFWWFFNGSSLTILPPDGEKDPREIIETTANKGVSTLIFVPSMFAPFVEYVKSKELVSKLSNLKYIILIGEALSPQLVMDFNELRTKYFSPRLVNTYGPTEATVAVSFYNCPEINPVDRVFIGKPISNTKLLVIDKNQHICPIGVAGELVISGENLARGYKNSPELNTSRFIEIKDLEGQNIKVYKTGDVAKWDENGELDFIGRIDNQVKIRGYRIELGDIETKLLAYESVETAVVIVNTIREGNKQLVAYVVLKNNSPNDSSDIKKFLKQNLPEYMVPAHIVVLDKMPLNSSEKIDRKALPKPNINGSNIIASPVSDTEKKLSQIWANLLNIQNISISSNFFDIGGNSLLVISMVSQIEKLLKINIEPVTIMQYSSIRNLAEYIDSMESSKVLDDNYNNIMEKAKMRRTRRNS